MSNKLIFYIQDGFESGFRVGTYITGYLFRTRVNQTSQSGENPSNYIWFGWVPRVRILLPCLDIIVRKIKPRYVS